MQNSDSTYDTRHISLFWVQFVSLNTMIICSTNFLVTVILLFFFTARLNSTMDFLIDLSFDGHLSWFYTFHIVNSSVIDMDVQESLCRTGSSFWVCRRSNVTDLHLQFLEETSFWLSKWLHYRHSH